MLIYQPCEPLATMNLEFSGIPVRVNNMVKAALSLEFTICDIQKTVHRRLY